MITIILMQNILQHHLVQVVWRSLTHILSPYAKGVATQDQCNRWVLLVSNKIWPVDMPAPVMTIIFLPAWTNKIIYTILKRLFTQFSSLASFLICSATPSREVSVKTLTESLSVPPTWRPLNLWSSSSTDEIINQYQSIIPRAIQSAYSLVEAYTLDWIILPFKNTAVVYTIVYYTYTNSSWAELRCI